MDRQDWNKPQQPDDKQPIIIKELFKLLILSVTVIFLDLNLMLCIIHLPIGIRFEILKEMFVFIVSSEEMKNDLCHLMRQNMFVQVKILSLFIIKY
jgi:hypothetical protein